MWVSPTGTGVGNRSQIAIRFGCFMRRFVPPLSELSTCFLIGIKSILIETWSTSATCPFSVIAWLITDIMSLVDAIAFSNERLPFAIVVFGMIDFRLRSFRPGRCQLPNFRRVFRRLLLDAFADQFPHFSGSIVCVGIESQIRVFQCR